MKVLLISLLLTSCVFNDSKTAPQEPSAPPPPAAPDPKVSQEQHETSWAEGRFQSLTPNIDSDYIVQEVTSTNRFTIREFRNTGTSMNAHEREVLGNYLAKKFNGTTVFTVGTGNILVVLSENQGDSK